MSLGKRLREARQARNLSIHQAYEHTRIHSDVISALENDKYEKVLNPTYVKSFLKEYASFLGFDVNEVINEYNRITSQDPQEHEYTKTHSKQNKKSEALSFLSNNAPLIIKSIVVLAIVLLVANGISKFFKSRASAEDKKEKIVNIIPKTAPQKKEISPEISQKAVVSIPKKEKLVLSIHTTDEVWLRLKVDGKVILENVLKKGESESWQAKENFSIWTGKAHALELSLNNVYIGTAGKGVVKNLIIDRKGIKR